MGWSWIQECQVIPVEKYLTSLPDSQYRQWIILCLFRWKTSILATEDNMNGHYHVITPDGDKEYYTELIPMDEVLFITKPLISKILNANGRKLSNTLE